MVISGQETVEPRHVRQHRVPSTVSRGVNDSNDDADHGRDTLGVHQYHGHHQGAAPLLEVVGLEDVSELVGHIHRHGVHPQEEADEGVVGEVGEDEAARSETHIIVTERNYLIDPVEEEVE